MRVLTLLPQSLLAGAPIAAMRMAIGLGRRGWSVAAAAPPGPVADRLGAAGIAVAPLRPGGGAARFWRFLRLLRRERPGVVHLHGALGPCRDLALAARLRGTPVAWHLHEDLAFPRYRRRLLAVRLLATRAVAVASCQLPHLPARRTVLSPNGVDTAAFAPPDGAARAAARAALGLGEAEFLAISVGRICADKGTFLLLAALPAARAAAPALRLLLAGGGGEGDVARAAALAARAGPGAARLLGPVADVASLLAAADLLVHPSRRENCPLAVLEAMAAGVPVLATPAGDTAVILGGGGRLLPEPGRLDAPALAMALAAAARGEGPGREREGRAGRERVVASYGLEGCLDRLERILMGAAGRGPAGEEEG